MTVHQPTIARSFLLQHLQPTLSGLMDGSLATPAPIFAVVLATHEPITAFFTGLSTALGAGVSIAFSEGLSDARPPLARSGRGAFVRPSLSWPGSRIGRAWAR